LQVHVVTLRLVFQCYFYGADVGRRAALFSWCHVLGSDADLLDFDVWEEFASDDFDDVDGEAYAFASSFDVDLLCSAVEEGYAG